MQVKFPRNRRGSYYVGGAHGTIGVLYVVLMACLMDQTILSAKKGVVELIEATCRDLLRMQSVEGGFPTKRPESEEDLSNVRFHWCHGAPGTIPAFLLAAEFFVS